MSYHIITNHTPRALQCLADLPKKARADFDYLSEDEHYSARFVQYRGHWYDAFDTQRIEPDNGRQHRMGWAMRVHPGEPLAWFDSIISDSYFSGVVFRFVDDDSVIVGTYIS